MKITVETNLTPSLFMAFSMTLFLIEVLIIIFITIQHVSEKRSGIEMGS